MNDQIAKTIGALRELCRSTSVLAPSVSHWSVGMHIQHCSKSMVVICRGLENSDETPPRSRRSISKTFVFMTGIIPRGKGKASARVRPDEAPEEHVLLQELEEAGAALLAARDLPADRWVEHPYFGPLRRDQALRFALIHSRHHLKIATDILAA